jgi:hypothetical protein
MGVLGIGKHILARALRARSIGTVGTRHSLVAGFIEIFHTNHTRVLHFRCCIFYETFPLNGGLSFFSSKNDVFI